MGVSRVVGTQCKFEGRAKELKVDGGVVRVHSILCARVNPGALANDAKQIFTLSGILGAGSDNRNDLFGPIRRNRRTLKQREGKGRKGRKEGRKEGTGPAACPPRRP